LDRGSPFQKAFAISAQNTAQRNKKKTVYRNENGEESIPTYGNEAVLYEGNYEEEPQQSVMVAMSGWSHGNKLAKRQKRSEAE
jgi:hypothetical protein